MHNLLSQLLCMSMPCEPTCCYGNRRLFLISLITYTLRHPYCVPFTPPLTCSDDLFSLTTPPGKTLCVGASYVSLECAGFLAKLGFDVTVMVRSILLRGFDQQMSEIVGDYMKGHGVNFLRGFVPTKIELIEEGPPRKLRVTYQSSSGGEEKTEEYNSVSVGGVWRTCVYLLSRELYTD